MDMYEPTKEEQGRIALLDKIKADTNKIEVKEVSEIFVTLLFSYFKITKTGKKVADKLTEEERVSFMTGFSNSFLSSLYVSASKDEKEQLKRMNEANKANKDVLVGWDAKERKK